jgi:hypothetical protein
MIFLARPRDVDDVGLVRLRLRRGLRRDRQRNCSEDRQSALCSVCAMRIEIMRNCVAYGTEVDALLAAECPRYINSVATCQR